MPRASAPTRPKSAIGPQLRLWLTLIGVIGFRGPLPPAFDPPAFEPGALAPAFFPAPPTGASLGLPPGFVLDGRVVPPPCCVLMLMWPRHMGWSGKIGPGA